MHPSLIAAAMRRGRQLLRAGILTHRQFALLDVMVFRCRAPGSPRFSVSYARLQDLAHVARATVAEAVRALEAAGLIRRTRTRVRVAWLGAVASRQGTNRYEILAPDTEFNERPACRGLKKNPSLVRTRDGARARKQEAQEGRSRLEAALERLGAAIAARHKEAPA